MRSEYAVAAFVMYAAVRRLMAGDYEIESLGMILAGIAGSWVGTRLRPRIPQLDFQRWFKWLVTLLALRMLVWPLMDG